MAGERAALAGTCDPAGCHHPGQRFEWANHDFLLTDASLQNLSQFVAPAAIIACGEIMLMIGGEIDLSAGMVFAFAPFVMAFRRTRPACRCWLPCWLAVAASALVGLVNGIITVRLRVPSFIATLGTNFLLNGLTLTLSHGTPVEAPGRCGVRRYFRRLGL